MLIEIFILVIFLVLSGLFSGLETAYVSITEIKARALVKRKVKGSLLLLKLKRNQRRVIITVLIGNNLVNVGSSAFAAVTLTAWFGSAGVGIATGVMTLLILTFGEILPKTYFAKHAEKISLKFAPFIFFLQTVLYPVVKIFELISNVLQVEDTVVHVSEGEVKAMIEVGTENKIFDSKQQELMEGVFDFDDTKVSAIMTPRVDIVAIPLNYTVQKALKIALSEGVSRVPVFEETVDKISGYVHIRDLISKTSGSAKKKQLSSLVHSIEHVSGEKVIQELFGLFQKKRQHLAVVVDEFGGTDGIITKEDILEELVGEIEDEHDEDELTIKRLNKSTFLLNGDTPLNEVNEKTDLGLIEDRHYTSLGGFVQFQLKDLPVEGQEITLRRGKVIVEKMDGSRIEILKIIMK
jgi:putative hemolysin